jgi:hypothetical protein
MVFPKENSDYGRLGLFVLNRCIVISGEKMTGAMTMPGEIRKYHFTVPKDVGPTPTDPQCITSSYQSFGDYARDMYSGLCGPLLICKPGTLDYNGKQVRQIYNFVVSVDFPKWLICSSQKINMKHVVRTTFDIYVFIIGLNAFFPEFIDV